MPLIVGGRTAEATKVAREAAQEGSEVQIETSAISSLGRAGYNEALDDFLHELLKQNPEMPYWESYFDAAAKAGRTDRMLALARVVGN